MSRSGFYRWTGGESARQARAAADEAYGKSGNFRPALQQRLDHGVPTPAPPSTATAAGC
ncbi:hypothetical protein O7632_17610 [Solwaraspora sp. WMMD406]|uniref:hypothetical protein n=1 Tax=Solwaraspora sp. WMMD406 TaxID=3016095 RepID=UPI0024160143|nr:hypothetical protein [Solwaraspora sp. WMMD406]MDG4765903.1 hypothetical protein [Solwaraspora sp. WMMD406]